MMKREETHNFPQPSENNVITGESVKFVGITV